MAEKAYQNLEECERSYATLPIGVGVFTENNITPLFLNDMFFSLIGYDKEEYASRGPQSVTDLVFFQDQDVKERIGKEYVCEGVLHDINYRIVRQDGSIRWIRLDLERIMIAGDPAALCFLQDRTPEKESAAMIALISDSIGESLSVLKVKNDVETFLYANDNFFALIGVSREEYLKHPHDYNMNHVSAEDKARLGEAIKASLATGLPQEFIYRFQRPEDDEVRVFKRRFMAVKQDEENSYYFISATTDITDQVYLSRDLSLERARYQALIDALPCGIAKLKVMPERRVEPLFVNNALLAMTSRTRDELMESYRQGLASFIHPDDLEHCQKSVTSFVTTSSSFADTYRMRRGRDGWLWTRTFGFIDEENGERVIYMTYLDVTDEHEQTLMLSSILDNLPSGVGVFRVSDAISCEYLSDSLKTFAGYSSAQVNEFIKNDTIFESTIYAPDLPAVMKTIRTSAQSRSPVSITYRYVDSAQEVHWISASGAVIREEGGCPVYYFAFMRPTKENILYHDIVEDSSNGIMIAEKANRRLILMNKAMRSVYGVPLDGMIVGKLLPELSPGSELLLSNEDVASLTPDHYTEFHKIQNYRRRYRLLARSINWNGADAYIVFATDETKEHEERVQNEVFVNQIPSGIAIYELDRGNVSLTYINDNFFKMTGLDRSACYEQAHKNVLYFVQADDIPTVEEGLNKISRTGRTAQVDVRLRCAHDTFRWFRLNLAVIARKGKKTTFYCNYTDIDETIKAHRALEAANSQIKIQYELEVMKRELLEQDSTVFVQLDYTQDRLLVDHVKDPLYREYPAGITSETLVKDLVRFIPLQEDRDKVTDLFSRAANLARVASGTTDMTIEYRSRQNDGCIHWLRVSSQLIEETFTGNVVGYVYIHDIDIEKKNSTALSVIVDQETDFVVLLSTASKKARLVRLSMTSEEKKDPAWNQPFDYAQFISPAAMEEVHPADQEAVRDYYDFSRLTARLSASPSCSLLYRVNKPEGVRYKMIVAFPLDELHEDILLVRRDITDLHEEEQKQKAALEHALAEANVANEAKSTFLANMSHDIRTPMNAILGMTHLAIGEVTNPEATLANLQTIQKSSDFMLSILNDILDISRIESGKFVLNCEWTTMNDVFLPVIEMITPNMEEKGITFTCPSVTRVTGYEYYMDVLKTQRMLMNLLNNACKFTPRGGHVTVTIENVSTDGTNGIDRIKVSDDGCGMTPEFLACAFEPFTQEHTLSCAAAEGTGLGLTIARKIARSMGGDITAESAIGKGTTFTIVYPYQYRAAT